MYAYCVYRAMSKGPTHLANFTKITVTGKILIVVNGVCVYTVNNGVCVYTVTIRSTLIGMPKINLTSV